MSFRDSFPAGAKMPCSPTNQIAAFTCVTCTTCIWMRAKTMYVRMCSSAAGPAHSRAEPAPPIVMAGRQLQPWVMVVIPVCLLVSSVLALPSECVGEPCMVPVGYITTAKLSPPSSSMSEPTRRGLWEVLVSLTYTPACFSISQTCHWSWLYL